MKHKKNTRFVSDIDQFCTEFDRTHALSASQQAEIAKYEKIIELRDQPITVAEADAIDGG